MSTPIINDPSAACPTNTPGFWARVPQEWQDNTSANFTDYSCAVPSCNNFPNTLASCCNQSISHLHQFDTDIGPYVACSLPDTENEQAYRDYQVCLFRQLVQPFKCNDPDPDRITVDVCQGGSFEPPIQPGAGEQVCAMRASPNATRAFVSCCSGAGNNGTGLIPFDSACNVACVSDSADMESCIRGMGLANVAPEGLTCLDGEDVAQAQNQGIQLASVNSLFPLVGLIVAALGWIG